MSKLLTNTTDLQEVLQTLQNKATGTENLDTEISTQSTLLSEQEAKIAELAQVLASKAGGENGNLNVANIMVNASYGTTFRYVGPDGLATLSGAFGGDSTIQVIIPSICFIESSNNGAAGFITYSTSGGCSTLFNNGFYACVEITSSGATIIAPSGTNSGGSSG